MTIPELAEAAGVSESTVGRVETGRRDSDLTFLLEEHLGITHTAPDSDEATTPALTAEEAARRLPSAVLLAEIAHRFALIPGDGAASGRPGEDFTWPTALGPHGTGQTGEEATPEGDVR